MLVSCGGLRQRADGQMGLTRVMSVDLNADPEKGLAARMHSEHDAVFHARPSRSEMDEW